MSWLRLEPFTAAQAEKDLSIFIGKVDISSFDLTEWYWQHQRTDTDIEAYRSLWRHIMTFNTDKKNNVSAV